MEALLKNRLGMINKPLGKFFSEVNDLVLSGSNVEAFSRTLAKEMERLDYDDVKIDKMGNVIGLLKGFSNKKPLVIISHMDYKEGKDPGKLDAKKNSLIAYKTGLVSSIYTAALLKSTFLPLTGNVYVCCCPRLGDVDYSLKYLFENSLKEKRSKISGVILAEPTQQNIYIGNKGKLEYEIIVKGHIGKSFLQNTGVNMLGSIFPLINELEKVSQKLPHNAIFGDSRLDIKNVGINRATDGLNCKEFKVVVDRVFVPEESSGTILKKAKHIAENVYNQQKEISISTKLAKQRVKTYTGEVVLVKKEFKPWSIASHHPFVLRSLEALQENRNNVKIDHWKNIVTSGGYLFSELGLPTIGFGVGSESDLYDLEQNVLMKDIRAAIYEKALMIYRNIGAPSFGWSSDEI